MFRLAQVSSDCGVSESLFPFDWPSQGWPTGYVVRQLNIAEPFKPVKFATSLDKVPKKVEKLVPTVDATACGPAFRGLK